MLKHRRVPCLAFLAGRLPGSRPVRAANRLRLVVPIRPPPLGANWIPTRLVKAVLHPSEELFALRSDAAASLKLAAARVRLVVPSLEPLAADPLRVTIDLV